MLESVEFGRFHFPIIGLRRIRNIYGDFRRTHVELKGKRYLHIVPYKGDYATLITKPYGSYLRAAGARWRSLIMLNFPAEAPLTSGRT